LGHRLVAILIADQRASRSHRTFIVHRSPARNYRLDAEVYVRRGRYSLGDSPTTAAYGSPTSTGVGRRCRIQKQDPECRLRCQRL